MVRICDKCSTEIYNDRFSYCINCGDILPDIIQEHNRVTNDRRCRYCGTKIEDDYSPYCPKCTHIVNVSLLDKKPSKEEISIRYCPYCSNFIGYLEDPYCPECLKLIHPLIDRTNKDDLHERYEREYPLILDKIFAFLKFEDFNEEQVFTQVRMWNEKIKKWITET
jgi:DNA-directed RNA polymerase subunit RPC12/RpoP